jgi:hypothetical protein
MNSKFWKRVTYNLHILTVGKRIIFFYLLQKKCFLGSYKKFLIFYIKTEKSFTPFLINVILVNLFVYQNGNKPVIAFCAS